MREKFTKEKIQIFILFIFIILFLVLIFLSFFNTQTNSINDPQKSELLTDETFTILPVEDNKKVILGANNQINLKENYIINTIYKNASLFDCENNENCIVYEIMKDESIYYISDQPFVFSSKSVGTTESEIVLTLKGGDSQLNTKLISVSNREFESPIATVTKDTQIPEQVYGCLESKICVNSGIMSSTISENAVELSGFIDFLNSIQQ